MTLLTLQTIYAELLQRALDAEFDDCFPARGRFKKRKKSNKYYWYFLLDEGGKRHEKYVGPVTDKSVTDRVKRFEEIKSDYKERRRLVRALAAAGVPAPLSPVGGIVEALWRDGFFRLRGVLVGTVAYGCYGPVLGAKLAASNLRTDDADFAQFWGISENIAESIRPPIEILKEVDLTFRCMPDVNDPFVTSRYRNSAGFKVEFLTPNRGAERHQSRPANMKALAKTSAQPLRHLDYLVHQPERAVILHDAGVPVSVPRAERYAIHKLIVAVERQDQAKATKDIAQASSLINVLADRRPLELAEAWIDAWQVGKRWQDKLELGRNRLTQSDQDVLHSVLEKARTSRKSKLRNFLN